MRGYTDKSRGSNVLFAMLGDEHEGIIGCDYRGAYRKFARLGNATVQYCMAHLIDRRITQGTRGNAGMRRCKRIWMTIATCKKQDRNVFEFIHKSLLANWTDKNYPLFL
ncbi:hypothetical protein ACFL3G_04525 [Planctomycetota bacterium]